MYQVVPGPVVVCAVATTIEVCADCIWAVGVPLSVTVAVKLKVPLAEGVPEIVPELAARVSPAGRLPAVIDQV